MASARKHLEDGTHMVFQLRRKLRQQPLWLLRQCAIEQQQSWQESVQSFPPQPGCSSNVTSALTPEKCLHGLSKASEVKAVLSSPNVEERTVVKTGHAARVGARDRTVVSAKASLTSRLGATTLRRLAGHQ